MKKLRNLLLISGVALGGLLSMVSSSCDIFETKESETQKLLDKINKLEQDNKTAQDALNAQISNLNNAKKSYELQIAQKNNAIQNYEAKITSLNEELIKLTNQNKIVITNLEQKIKSLQDEIKNMNDAKLNYEKDIKVNEVQILDLKNSESEKQAEIHALSEDNRAKKQYVFELEEHLAHLTDHLEDLRNRIDQKDEQLAKKQEIIKQNEEIVAALNAQKNDLNKQIGELKNQNMRLILNHQNELAKKNEQISSLQVLLAEKNNQPDHLTTNANILINIYDRNSELEQVYTSEFNALKQALKDFQDDNKSTDKLHALSTAYSNAITSAISLYSTAIRKLNVINAELESPLIPLPTDNLNNLTEYLKELILLISRNKAQVLEQYNTKLESYARAFNLISRYQIQYNPINNAESLNLAELIAKTKDQLKSNIWHYISEIINHCDEMNISGVEPAIKSKYQSLKNEITKGSYLNLSFEYLLSSLQELIKFENQFSVVSAEVKKQVYENKANLLKAIKEFEDQNSDFKNYANFLPEYKEIINLKDAITKNKNNYEELLDLIKNANNKLNKVKSEVTNFKIQYNGLKTHSEHILTKLKELNKQLLEASQQSTYYKQNPEIQALLEQSSESIQVLNSISWTNEDLSSINSKVKKVEQINKNVEKLWAKFESNMNAIRSGDEIDSFYQNNSELVKKLSILNKGFRNTALSNFDIYDSIFKRTFKIVFWNRDDNKPREYVISSGTAWLLDYASLGDNKYRLYLATNAHVAASNINPDAYSDVKQVNKLKQGSHTFDYFIGFDPNWANHENEYYMFEFSKQVKEHEKYIPKNFYVAKNFMSDKKVNGPVAADFAVMEWYVDLNEFANWNYNNFINTLSYYKPGIDISSDYKTQNEYSTLIRRKTLQAAFVQHIKDAIEEIDKSKKSISSKEIANFNTSLPYISVDYMSTKKILREYNLMYPNNRINDYTKPLNYKSAIYLDSFMNTKLGNSKFNEQPNNVFIAGYPAKGGEKTEINGDWSKLYEAKDNIHNYNLTDTMAKYEIGVNRGYKINYDNVDYESYMLQFYVSSSNDLTGGASGSLAVNEDGLPVGIKWGSTIDGDNKYYDSSNQLVHSYRDVALSFVNTFDVPLAYTNISDKLYAYNLIDGTDKSKYPYQVSSYRHALIKHYGPKYKTALFNK
ncbi:MIP family Ig-specific serine endopeptidase [Mycoplasma sp. 005V]|uniref:MIP family Ig-specific serine endopeptidase n=1 Tax=Mycoplasma sp. 005V TaxID=3398776 RepID=UPI003A8C6335